MSEFRPRVTRMRMVAGISILVVATTVLLLAGVDPSSYLSGVIVGIIGVGAVVVFVEWRRHKANRDRAPNGSFLGKSREFWASRRAAVMVGAIMGALTGAFGAGLLIWAAPVDHWVRDSWILVGAGYAVVMAGMWILISLFIWWINVGIERKY